MNIQNQLVNLNNTTNLQETIANEKTITMFHTCTIFFICATNRFWKLVYLFRKQKNKQPMKLASRGSVPQF